MDFGVRILTFCTKQPHLRDIHLVADSVQISIIFALFLGTWESCRVLVILIRNRFKMPGGHVGFAYILCNLFDSSTSFAYCSMCLLDAFVLYHYLYHDLHTSPSFLRM